jgi:hypothetical protein
MTGRSVAGWAWIIDAKKLGSETDFLAINLNEERRRRKSVSDPNFLPENNWFLAGLAARQALPGAGGFQ